MSTNKRIAKRLLSAILTILMLMSMVTIGMASASAATLELAETGANLSGGEVLYLKPNSNWTQAGARFAIYLFSKNGDTLEAETWVDMTSVEGETGVYEAAMPSGTWKNLIFCRMNPSTTTNSWSNKWDQTNDLAWDGKNNCYAVADGAWSNGAGSWSTYTPPVVIPEYNVTFNDGQFKVTGDAKVTEGEDYTFTVEATSGYEITKVTCNDAELTAVDGTYTVADVKADLSITITVTEIKTYSVMFADYDGTVLSSETVEEGAEVKIPADPTRAGYFFTGWTPAPEVTRDDETGKWITVADNAVFTAQYKADSNDTPIITPPTQEEEEETSKWTVMFVDYDNTLLKIAKVEDGKAAEAPEAPTRAGYTFTGWSQKFDNVTADLLVVAQYEKDTVPVVTPTIGKLQVEVAGGTGFTIAVDGGTARPQGTSYMNTKMPIGTSVTLVATSSNENEFMGWMNNAGVIVSTTDTYTFKTAGNDFVKAMYITEVESVNYVIYKNDKAAGGNGQILDMQYYAAGDEIVVPDDAAQAGYTFTGWSKSVEDIQAELAAGNDVVVTPVFEVRKYYVDVNVTNGSVTAHGGISDGKYLAYKGTTVTADAAPEGQKFAYWTDGTNIKSYKAEYKFYPAYDINLTAVYVAEDEVIEEIILTDIAADSTVDGNNITFVTSWYVPESVGEFEAGGVLVVEASNYNESTFVVGGGDPNVTQGKPSKAQYADQPGTALTKQNVCYAGTTWYGVTWVQYTDANGELQTVYSDMIEVTKY